MDVSRYEERGSIPSRGREFFLRWCVQSGSETVSITCPVNTGGQLAQMF